MIGELLGSYRVVSRLGAGGMGVVYVAEHPLIGQKVAIKLLLPEFSRNAEIVNRFFNEAKAAALAKHPGIIGIFDFGYHPNGSAYIVMEFLEGESLGGRLQRLHRLGDAEALRIVRQVAGALVAAHAKGVVHRDLKPDNLFMVPDSEVAGGERVKVLDFGIAKLSADASSSVKTRTGSMFGSPAYMSPEQCRGSSQIDERSDVYSLGCVLYEIVCGCVPFTGEGAGEVIGKHLYEPVIPPRQRVPSISEAVETVILHAMEKDVEKRPQSMRALLSELDAANPAGVGRPITSPASDPTIVAPAVPRPASAVTTLGGATGATSSSPGSTRNRSSLVAAVATVLVVAAVGVALVVSRGGSGDGKAPQAGDAAGELASAEPARDEAETPAKAPSPAPSGTPPLPAQPSEALDPSLTKPMPRKASLYLTSEPTGAEVIRDLDKVRLGKTPFTLTIDRVDGEVVLLIRKSGFRPSKVSISAGKDSETNVKLERLPKAEPAPRKDPPPTPKKPKDELDPYAE